MFADNGTEFEGEVPGSGAEINYNITVLQGQYLNYVSGALPYVSPTFYESRCPSVRSTQKENEQKSTDHKKGDSNAIRAPNLGVRYRLHLDDLNALIRCRFSLFFPVALLRDSSQGTQQQNNRD
jgi:hypothetical protein